MTQNNKNQRFGRVGITERGDAGRDLSWAEKLNGLDLAILITKDLNEKCREKIMEAHQAGNRLIVHTTCTGWGGSFVEPHVPDYRTQLHYVRALLNAGFPIRQIVLRIDPIIPTYEGLKLIPRIIEEAYDLEILPEARIRVSVLDEYKHVRERLTKLGCPGFFYPGDQFSASDEQFAQVSRILAGLADLTFETCAEPKLSAANIARIGCISKKDYEVFGLTVPNGGVNPQNRHGCLCMSGKTELLENRQQCPHKCVYCYWK